MNINTNQLILLVEKFLSDIKKAPRLSRGRFDVTDDYKLALMEDTAYILAGDLDYRAIANTMDQVKNKKHIEKSYNLSDILEDITSFQKGSLAISAEELIQLGRFYYHPLLQETAKPAKYVMNQEDQSYEKVEEEPFFLEVRTTFTLDDLVDFFLHMNQDDYPNRKGIKTQFQNILPRYGLDLVLYMIEASVLPNENGTVHLPKTPRFLENTEIISEGKRLLANRYRDFKEENIYGIIPKKENKI